MASVQMAHIFWIFWWADRQRFIWPGLYVWLAGKNRRIVPLPSKIDPETRKKMQRMGQGNPT